MNGLLSELYIEISDLPNAETLLAKAVAANASPGIPVDVSARVFLAKSHVESEKGACDAAIASAKASLALVDVLSGDAASVIANADDRIALCLIRKGEFVQALELLAKSITRDTVALGANSDVVADEWLLSGVAQAELARFDEAQASFDRSIDLFSALYGENSTHVAHALNELSNMLDDKGDLAASEDALRRALKIRLAIVGPDHRDTLAVQANLLYVMETRGHFAEALPQRLAFTEKASRNPGFYKPDQIANFISLGRDYRELGRLVESEKYYRDALAVGASMPEGPTPTTMRNLGVTLLLQGRYSDAESTSREALALQSKTDPPNSPRIGMMHADIGNALRMQHRYSDAMTELRAADTVFANAANVNNPLRWFALAALCEGLVDTGDLEGATAAGEQAVSQARVALGKDHFQLGTPLYALARARLANHDASAAEALLREAAAVRSPLYPPDDVRMLEVNVALTGALAAQGKTGEAETIETELHPLLKASTSPYAADLHARLPAR